jgi:hypothetical protein
MSRNDTHSFVIRHAAHLARAKAILDNLDLSREWSFELKPYRRNRSAEANALLWTWYRVISDEIGTDPQSLHESMKVRFLIPILLETDEDFRSDVELLREIYQTGKKDAALKAKDRLYKRASTTWLNTKDFSRFMNSVEEFASGYGISLQQPEQLQS